MRAIIGLLMAETTIIAQLPDALPSINGVPTSVHPHACGEYEEATKRVLDVGGSPPRVWGIQTFLLS